MLKSKILAVTLLVSCGGNGNGKPLSSRGAPGALGAATLSWVAPTERTDNTPLTNLAGFNVYYGTAPGLYTDSIRIENPSVNIYVVEPLDSGSIYYFSVTAFDTDGIESDFSNEASKVID